MAHSTLNVGVAGAGKNLATAKSGKDCFELGIKDAVAVEIRTFEV